MYFEPDLLEDFISSYRVGTVCHLQQASKPFGPLERPTSLCVPYICQDGQAV